jgi:DNA-directed RNA polymerase III subunit RPC1
VCKVLHEKLSEVGMSMLVEKNASDKDITSDIGFSADFLKSLQSFVEKNTTLTKSIGEDDSSNLKNFLPKISGISRRQLEVFI